MNSPPAPRLTGASPAPRRTWAYAALLASLAMVGPFSVDMYLPAFRAIGEDLGAPPLALQQTLSAYMFAFAFMMLWHGALSDALGRRPTVLAGLAIYALATLGCAIAGNIESLWLFRALQGLSAGVGTVVGRAIIRDRFEGPEAQKLMSQLTMVFALAPALAPVVGGVLLELLGWRSIFWVLLIWTLAVLALAWRKLAETLPVARRQSLRPSVLARNYRKVLGRGDFALLALIPALNFSAFFMYIAVAPTFLIERLGVSTTGFAWLFVPMIGGIALGAMVSGRLAGRISPKHTVRLGFAFMAAGVIANLGICLLAPPLVALNVLPIMIYTVGSGIATPTLTLLLLDLVPESRGLVTSLQGFVQFSIAGFNAGTIAPFLAHSLVALSFGMAAFTVASGAIWLVYQRHHRIALRGWRT